MDINEIYLQNVFIPTVEMAKVNKMLVTKDQCFIGVYS